MEGRDAKGHTVRRRSLPLMTAAERLQVLHEFNDTKASYPQDQLIHKIFEERVQLTPEAVAVAYEGHHLTYGNLNSRANRLARRLRDRGIGPDDLVGVCAERGLEMVIGLLGILKAGGAYLPLDPNYPDDRLQYMLADAAPRVLLTQRSLTKRLPTTAIPIAFLDDESNHVQETSDNASNIDRAELRPDHLAYVIYTSGSTGDPKGVMIEHRNVTRLFAATAHWFGFNHSDVWTLFHSFAFDFSVWELWGALLYGGRLVVVPQSISRAPQEFYRLICDQKVTVLNQTPSAFVQLTDAQAQSEAQHSLRVVIFGGEALEMRALRPWVRRNDATKTQLVNMYGITETTVHVTYRVLTQEEIESERASLIGKPIPDLKVYLLDQHKEPVPIGMVGEIYVGGAGVARGYLNKPQLTAERLVADPFQVNAAPARLYKSGDLARWRPDGSIEYLGRNDHQVKIRGFRVELGEIETQLVRHAPVKEAVVLAREDVPGEKRLVAYLVPRNPGETESSLRAETLRAALKTCLPEYMVPSAFVILERFPLTGNGKLDRRALPAPELGAYATSQYEVPEGKVEEALADIWQRLLRVERVGRKDNFFALGGHSLQGMQLIAQIEQKLVVGLPPTAVFQYPTVQQMASAVSSLLATNATTSITPDGSSLRLERAPATFSQLAHWHMYRLSERRAIRQIASAIRLHGQLNVEALRQSLAAVVRRHDALRVRIVVTDGVPTQEISQIDGSELKCSNLTALSEQAREAEVSRMIEELILEPINPMVAPLFGVWLAKLRETEHVLVVAMEHMISDAVSMSILLRDLFSAYAHILRGHAPSLPAIPLQFPEYAVLQRNTHAAWMERHGAYWARRRAECSRTRFPVDKDAPEGDGIGWGTTPLRIGTRLKGQLQEWCRLRHTTLALSVLTAYIATVLRWCDVSEAVVVYQTDGRFDPKVQHTIGYFASALYLRVRLLESDSFVDFLTRVTSEYVAASEHADSFYMESQVPPPEFTRSSCFNWVSPGAEMDSSELTGLPEALTYSPITFEHPMLKGLHRETDPFVLLQASADQVFGGLHFPRNRFSVGTMEKFSRQFLGLIEQMLRDPQRRVREIASLD